MGDKKIRKQVYELMASDLELHPAWEFALDEEGEDGQDEATVRPCVLKGALNPRDGMFVVRAAFELADGTQLMGYLTPGVQGDRSIGAIQPIVVTPHGQVNFWCGAFPPSPETIGEAYLKLGRPAAGVFPCRYQSAIELVGGPVSGTLRGFMHYRSLADRTVVETR